MWYAGIDWADQHHDAVVIDEAGKRVGTTHVAYSAEGLGMLMTFLKGIGDVADHPDHLACIVGTNRGLLITALLDAGLPVYPVNPKTVDRRRKPAGAKTDAIDAYLLARTGRSDLADLRRLTPDSPLIAELKALTRDQDTLIQSQTRLANQLMAGPCLRTAGTDETSALPVGGADFSQTLCNRRCNWPVMSQAGVYWRGSHVFKC